MKISLTRFRPSGLLAASILLAGCCEHHPITDEPPNDVRISPVEPGQGAPTAPIRVWAVHDPLYAVSKDDDLTHEAKIIARAIANTGFLARIDINVTIGPIASCEEPDVFPCMDTDEALAYIQPCPFGSNVRKGECTYQIDVTEDQIVSYAATATDSSDTSVTTQQVSFAYGMPPGGTVRPIWWHVGEPIGIDRISLGFFPDEDYQRRNINRYPEFAMRVNDIVTDVFFYEAGLFNEVNEYPSTYTANRNYFDLWAAPFGANVESPCHLDFAFDGDAAPAHSLLDAAAIVHLYDLDDCADIRNPGTGSVFGSTVKRGWIMAHEGGHFIFGLADEYESGGHTSCSTPTNIFLSRGDCDSYADLPANCKQIGQTGVWRIDDDSYELMDNEEEWEESAFRRSAVNAVANRFAECHSGQCFDPGNPPCIGD
ncbi:MAG: hypothetical protein ACREQ8_10950 [Woeseiaceae bacterium]